MARKAVLVTGGAKRLGREFALRFAKAGYDVALHYRSSKALAEKVAEEIRSEGVSVILLQGDLLETKRCAELIAEAKQALPGISVLINSASMFEPKPFAEVDEAKFDADMGIHVKAPFFLTQAFAKQVGEGSVINIADTFTKRHKTDYFTYLLSKKTLIELSQMMAATLGPKIRVNAVCPGTTLPTDHHGEEYMHKLAARLPQQRNSTPEEVADTVFWLAESSLTGQVVYADGGEQLI